MTRDWSLFKSAERVTRTKCLLHYKQFVYHITYHLCYNSGWICYRFIRVWLQLFHLACQRLHLILFTFWKEVFYHT